MKLIDPWFWRRLRGAMRAPNYEEGRYYHYIPSGPEIICPGCQCHFSFEQCGLKEENFSATITCSDCACVFDVKMKKKERSVSYHVRV